MKRPHRHRGSTEAARRTGAALPTTVLEAIVTGMVVTAAIGVALVTWSRSAPASEESPFVLYSPPVDGPVLDPFRPPAHIGATGNRGIEYANPPFVPVVAAADGVVRWAGSAFGSGVVVIDHADGVRTTYGPLSEVWTASGVTMRHGEAIALAGGPVHLGALIRDEYLDPQILIDASEGSVRSRLVPVEPAD